MYTCVHHCPSYNCIALYFLLLNDFIEIFYTNSERHLRCNNKLISKYQNIKDFENWFPKYLTRNRGRKECI